MLNNTNLSNSNVSSGTANQSGFTILELIIAMIVFLIVTGAAYGVLLVAKRSRTTVNQQVQLAKNVRLALNLVGRDTYNAGFDYPIKYSVNLRDNKMQTLLGIPADAGTADDPIPPVIAGNNINPDTFANPNTNTDQVTFLFKDSSFNLVGSTVPTDKRVSQPLIISSLTPAGNINQATILPSSGTNDVCNVNDLFVITGSTGSALGVVTKKVGTDVVQFANGDILTFNKNGATSPITSLTPGFIMQRVTLVTYFVTADGILTRRDYANNSTVTKAQPYIDNPLVYGVEDFQIQYISNDGTISDDPGAGATANTGDPTKLNLVRQIKFTVNAASTELNEAGQPYRVTMTTTFSTRNLGYDVN